MILASLGTDGDIIPYVGLGAVLRRRGHRVTLVAAEDYQPLAEDSGFEFRPLASREENHQLLSHPDFWHPLKGGPVGARWGRALLPRHHELFSELARDGEAVFIASPALLAARVVQEKLGVPLATPILQPWMIPSSSAPPVMPAGLTLPRWAPRPAAALYWRALNGVVGVLLGGALNELCEREGLPPVRRIFPWWFSPQLVLCMFPAWYGPPQPDWLPQIRLTGFPIFDGVATPKPLDEDLLAFCRAGEKPVAFTFGTGVPHATHLYHASVEACRLLNLRGIVLTKHAGQLPSPLPPTVRHVPFAPFRELFPRCAAVVHHGGIGTVAKCFEAGVPQVILPIAYDQKDNAIRVKRLGTGDWVRAGRASGPRIAELVKRVVTPEVKVRCGAIAARFAGEDALGAAADAVEALVRSESSTPAGRSAP